MTELIAVQWHLSYKGTNLQDFPRIWLRIIEGGPDDIPDVRGRDVVIPGRTGQIYGSRKEHRLGIMLRGWVAGAGPTEVLQRRDTALARQALHDLFDPTGGEGTLHVETEDGVEWEIEAFPEALIWQANDEGIPTHRTVSVRLTAVDPPYWTTTGS